MIPAVPKAELHAHIEGTMTPQMVQKIALRNGLAVPPGLFTPDGREYGWTDDGTAYGAFLAMVVGAYDRAAKVLRTEEDYRDITYDYLSRTAKEGAIYVELTISADHGLAIGLSYPQMVAAIARGIDEARRDFGIECRLLSACVRHYGVEKAIIVAQLARDFPHPYVTGFAMAGDERAGTIADFKPAFDIAEKAGLQRTAHAGEALGPESIRDAWNILGIRRFGHMVRVVEDEVLMRQLQKAGIVPEVCVSSNIALRFYKNYAEHPLHRLKAEGFKITLNSDDPPFFRTTLGREYQIAQDHFGFTRDDLLAVTRNAIEAAFVDETSRKKLLFP